MDIMVIVYAILAYLIGSIPSGLIIGKTFFNTDVRQYGSKNICLLYTSDAADE